MKFSVLSLVAGLALSTAGHGATVSLTIRGVDGRPLPGAVVTIDTPRAPPVSIRGPYVMEQRDIAFQPHVLIVPVGATVGFPNRDKVRHHVYSFSRVKKVDLKLYGREDMRTVSFDRPGVVSLGCNIHDAMSGFVFVTATPFAMLTDAAGHVAIAGVPAGAATVRVWHPTIRAAGNSMAQPVVVAAAGLSSTLSLQR